MEMLKLFKLQITSIEFLIALIIFIFLILTLFTIQTKKINEFLEYYEDLTLLRDLDTIEVLLDIEGKPKDWNNSNFEVLGLRTNGKIDMKKVNYLKEIDYKDLKKYLLIRNEFCIKNFEVGNCSYENSQKIFVRKKIASILINNFSYLDEIKIIVWN